MLRTLSALLFSLLVISPALAQDVRVAAIARNAQNGPGEIVSPWIPASVGQAEAFVKMNVGVAAYQDDTFFWTIDLYVSYDGGASGSDEPVASTSGQGGTLGPKGDGLPGLKTQILDANGNSPTHFKVKLTINKQKAAGLDLIPEGQVP